MLPTIFGTQIATSPFSLMDIEDFPYSDYSTLQGIYETLESWYSGLALQVTQTQGDKEVDLYPLRLNPIRSALMKHVHTLFGEIPDSQYGSLITPKVLIRNGKPDTVVADKIEQFLMDTWEENGGASLQEENAINSQVFGGCIFKISWVPDVNNAMKGRIGIEKILPKEFMCVPYMNNPWRLRKAWVVRPIDAYTAKQFNVSISGLTGWYIESWEENQYRIAINNVPILQKSGDDLWELSGPNPQGFVPFVYIPHERANSFWGTGVITEAVIGITKEINSRIADAGDATSDESHSILAMRNVRGAPQLKTIGRHIKVVDLGSSQSLNNVGEPDLISVKRASLSETMILLVKDLQASFRREVSVPAVADGEDEGSQRSGATLANRMWPLVSHSKGERIHWSTGLTVIHKMILVIAALKGVGNIQTSDLDCKLRNKWYSSLPRDREQLSTELVSRAGQDLGSHEHLLEMYGDVDDVEEDMQKNKDWLTFKAELKTQAASETAGGTNGQSNSTGSQGTRSA